MKLAIIHDYLASNQCNGPDPKVITAYGHKLLKLWQDTEKLGAKYSCTALAELGADAGVLTILQFLDSFSKSSGRYANINGISPAGSQMGFDPLSDWGRVANLLFSQNASARQHKQADQIRIDVDESIGMITTNLIAGLSKESMSAAQLHKQAFMIDISSQHAVFHIVRLVEGLRTIIGVICDLAHQTEQSLKLPVPMIPHMNEFFEFAWSDPSVLRKKRWP